MFSFAEPLTHLLRKQSLFGMKSSKLHLANWKPYSRVHQFC